MFKQFKKKMAIAANVMLVMQVVIFGLGANPTAVKAAENLRLSTNLDTVNFVAGQTGEFNFTLTNNSTVDYSEVAAKFVVKNSATTDIANLDYVDGTSLTPVSLDQVGADLEAEYSIGDIVSGFSQVYPFKVKFNTPKKYELNVTLTDSEGNSVGELYLSEAYDNPVNVAENIQLSATLPTKVKMASDVSFDATLDNTYGADHNIRAALTISSSALSDVAKLTADGTPVTLSPDTEGNLVATFTGSVNATDILTYDMVVNFAVDRSFNYSFVVTDSDSDAVLATKTGTVYSDGTSPAITVLPKMTNNVSKDLTITFTGNEDISSYMPGSLVTDPVNANFTQGTNSFTFPVVKVNANSYSVVVPANTITPGTTPVRVGVTFYDLVGNKADVDSMINVDTVAPAAVMDVAATVNADNKVILTWVNPNTETDYVGIRVKRDGAILANLAKGTVDYTDTEVEAGKTYQYEVIVYDEAGNEITIAPISVIVPAPAKVASIASDSQIIAAPKEEKKAEGEVKSESTESSDEKSEEVKSNLPLWGIILLGLLAIVGGYLYFAKDEIEKPTAQKIKVTAKKKNVAGKKKKK